MTKYKTMIYLTKQCCFVRRRVTERANTSPRAPERGCVEWMKGMNGEGIHVRTLRTTLSYTDFGALQNPNQWELGLQIWISCSYVFYVWCVQTILGYLPWSRKFSTCSGGTSISSEQVFQEDFCTIMVVSSLPHMLERSFWSLWTGNFKSYNFH